MVFPSSLSHHIPGHILALHVVSHLSFLYFSLFFSYSCFRNTGGECVNPILYVLVLGLIELGKELCKMKDMKLKE